MAKYRHRLPQLDGRLFLTDSGMETTLVFHEGFELPCFAAFDLFRDERGVQVMRDYYRHHAGIALDRGVGFILESPTWRSNPDWAEKLGYSPAELDQANRQGIELMCRIRAEMETDDSPMVISGCIGPRGDGYDPAEVMSVDGATAYHQRQIQVFAETDADLVTAITMTNVPEAIGITRAAQAHDMPVVISFTVETDGRLPTGESLKEAITAVDADTNQGPTYYMINCAHPSHFQGVLEDEAWMGRIRALRGNASKLSHAELDEAETLDSGDPVAFGRENRALRDRFPHINVLGGCCGTDHRHIEQLLTVQTRAA